MTRRPPNKLLRTQYHWNVFRCKHVVTGVKLIMGLREGREKSKKATREKLGSVLSADVIGADGERSLCCANLMFEEHIAEKKSQQQVQVDGHGVGK